MSFYNVVSASDESTVITEYKPSAKRSDSYQSEADLEGDLFGYSAKRVTNI